LTHAEPHEQDRDGPRQRWHQRNQDEQDIGREVCGEHGLDQSEEASLDASNAERPAKTFAQKKMAPSVAGLTPNRS
jgi:hypothetical protein